MRQNRENGYADHSAPAADACTHTDVRPETIDVLLNSDTVCIFPSEVSARFWLEQAAVLSAEKTTESVRGASPYQADSSQSDASHQAGPADQAAAAHQVGSAHQAGSAHQGGSADQAEYSEHIQGAGENSPHVSFSRPVSVVRADRFVSWDRFLESCSSKDADAADADGSGDRKEAADAMIRETAALRLAEELSAESASSGSPVLSYFIPPEYSSSAHRYRGTLSALLPHADRLEQALPELPHLSEPMKRDIRFLSKWYRDFLERHNLYEPNHLSGQLAAQLTSSVLDRQKQYVLFFPEILLGQEDCIEMLSSFDNFDTCSGNEFFRAQEPETGSETDSEAQRETDCELGGEAECAAGREAGNEPGSGTDSDLRIRVFENSRQELHWLTAAVERLMQEGVQPQDIVITAADFDSWYGLISEETAIRGLPWVFRRGRALSDYPAARFFSDVQSAVRSRWSLRDVKRLFLNRGYPWKYREAFERIAAVGIKDVCLRNYEQEKNQEVNVWVRALELRDEQKLLKLWRQFTGSAAGLTAETKPEQLQRRLLVFIDTWLDRGKSGADDAHHGDAPREHAADQNPDARSPDRTLSADPDRTLSADPDRPGHAAPDRFNDVFDFCIETWMQLAAVCRKLHIEQFPSLYSFWTQQLDSQWYVPQIHQEGTEIYSYGLSAGMHPKHHFIIGASQQHTTIRDTVFPGAGDDFSRMFGIPVIDRSADYLELYAKSGQHTYISCSRTTADGPHLPPSWFVERNAVQDIRYGTNCGTAARPETPEENQYIHEDTWNQEQIWWESGQDSSLEHRDIMTSVYPVQRNGFMQAYRTIFRKKPADISSEILGEDPVLSVVVRKRLMQSDEGLTEISPTQLDTFMKCPFQWLFQRLLNIDDVDMDPGYSDPRDDGALFHAITQHFFANAVGIGHYFHAQELDDYRKRMGEIIQDELRKKRSVWVRLVPAAEQRMQEWLEEAAEALLSREAELLDGWKCTAAEQTLRCVREHDGVVLSGRIDRISQNPEETGFAVIDYKRGIPKSGGAYQAADSEIPSYQLPFYGLLIERGRGEQVSAALYFSVTGRKYQIIYHDACFTTKQHVVGRDRFAELMDETEKAVGDMMQRIRQGDMSCTESAGRCSGCAYRDLCRKRYTVQ